MQLPRHYDFLWERRGARIRGDLSIRDNNGNVDVSGVGGAADLTNSFGNVTFSDVKGRVVCTTNKWPGEGSSLTGNSATIRDSFGDIEWMPSAAPW